VSGQKNEKERGEIDLIIVLISSTHLQNRPRKNVLDSSCVSRISDREFEHDRLMNL
jgi:hypothetical protein